MEEGVDHTEAGSETWTVECGNQTISGATLSSRSFPVHYFKKIKFIKCF